MKKIFGFLAVLVTIAAVAIAVPLTPGISVTALIKHSHGGFQGVTTTITIASSSSWKPIKNATDNLWVQTEGVGFSWSSDNLVVAAIGDYTGLVTIALSGTNGDDVFIRCFNVTDNVQSGYIIGATMKGSTSYHPVTIPLYLEVHTDNTKFRFEVENTTAGRDVVIRSAIYQVQYLHD